MEMGLRRVGEGRQWDNKYLRVQKIEGVIGKGKCVSDGGEMRQRRQSTMGSEEEPGSPRAPEGVV